MRAYLVSAVAAVAVLAAAAQAQAIDVQKSVTVAVSADQAWSAIKDFCSPKEWLPPIADCSLSEKDGALHRELVLGDGAKVLEVERFHSDTTKTVTYSIVDSPLPLVDYWSMLSVTALGADKAEIRWAGRFAAPEGKDKDATDLISGLYQAGLDSLADKLGQ